VLKTLGRYEEAIQNLDKARKIREKVKGEERDAAITRDELGCCYQALGQPEKAREIRLSQGEKAVICSNESCSRTARQCGVPELLQCGRCKAIWYCSANCQKIDWKKNHKKVCQLAPEPVVGSVSASTSSEETGKSGSSKKKSNK
jgi:hypothetical protein